MDKRLKVSHGIVYEAPPASHFGYFGWPTVSRINDGTIVVAASGFRTAHVCPWGKTVIFCSHDEGKTWSEPEILNDTPVDDRDAGILSLGSNKLLVSWFGSDTRYYLKHMNRAVKNPAWFASCSDVTELWTDELVKKWIGSFIRIRDEKGKWSERIPIKLTTPHGPIKLRDGRLFYLGKSFGEYDENGILCFKMNNLHDGHIQAITSDDGGFTWKELGCVERPEEGFFCEPYAVELDDGKIIGMLRKEGTENKFSMFQTESEDGGRSWSKPHFISYGSPPHLLMHSSKALICVYGYRLEPYGQRVMFSRDSGKTWDGDWIMRDDGSSGDLGYPSTVELADGSLFSVYYQAAGKNTQTSLLFTKWEMP